jgi:hypothetical protein
MLKAGQFPWSISSQAKVLNDQRFAEEFLRQVVNKSVNENHTRETPPHWSRGVLTKHQHREACQQLIIGDSVVAVLLC